MLSAAKHLGIDNLRFFTALGSVQNDKLASILVWAGARIDAKD